MANDIDMAVKQMTALLDSLPADKNVVRVTAIFFGKYVKGYKIKSKKDTLTTKEIITFTQDIKHIYINWAKLGTKDWEVKEIDGIRFTIKFTRVILV